MDTFLTSFYVEDGPNFNRAASCLDLSELSPAVRSLQGRELAGMLKRVIDRIVHVASDEEVIVEGRKAPGYETLYVAFSRLRYSYRTERDLGQALERVS